MSDIKPRLTRQQRRAMERAQAKRAPAGERADVSLMLEGMRRSLTVAQAKHSMLVEEALNTVVRNMGGLDDPATLLGAMCFAMELRKRGRS